jgi:CHAT domain-containing protein
VNQPQGRGTVYDEYLATHPNRSFAVIDLGATALTHVHLVESVFLVPSTYVETMQRDSSITYELLMAAAWEVLEPMSEDGLSAALGAQTLAALGGNPLRAQASPRRHVRLVLTALDGFRGRGLPRHEGRGYVALGEALFNFGRVADAITALERGRTILEPAGDDHGLRAAYARLAALMARLGLYEQSLLHAEAGQRIGKRLPVTGPEWQPAGQVHFTNFLHHQRVRALTRIGFVDEAEAALDEWRKETAVERYPFDLLGATAELKMQQGRTAEGLEAYLRAIDARFRDLKVGSLPGRTFYLENSVRIVGGAVGAALNSGRPDLAVAIFAASATRRPVRSWDGTPPVAATEALRSLDARVPDLTRAATAAAVARDYARLFELNDRARTLLETRDTILYETRVSGQQEHTTVEELAAAIPRAGGPGELALLYAQSEDGTVIVFAIWEGAVRHFTLARHADEVALLASYAYDECVQRSGVDSLNRLGEAVLEPVADLLAKASRVYVTGQGILQDFPFHAAPFRGEPLVAAADVRALPSIAPLGVGGRRREPVSDGRSLRAVVVAVRQPRYELLPELPALRAESEAVRRAFATTTGLYDDEATTGVVRDAFGAADVLHLAGHAVFEPLAPNMARMLLADRPLFAFEVACARRAPRLVNLSCCRAGAERRSVGGEGEGLAAAFLAAGTETVVAPLWPVRDDAALAFNEALYQELARPDAELAQAARHAQLSLMAHPQFAHPGLWGAFTVLGRL